MDITELLGPSNLKKLRFLELLNAHSTEWISRERLALDLNISVNGLLLLYDSVSLSTSNLMSKIKIEVSSGLGFKLKAPISSILDEIRLELLKSEISFNLVLDSFNNNYMSKTIFLERMFISRATFYREINKLKNFLVKFKLSFNSKNGKIIGELNEIRKFYFHFFWQTYKTFDWPFKKNYFDDAKSMIDSVQKSSTIRLDLVTKRRFMYLLAIVFNDVHQELIMKEKVNIQVKENSFFSAIALLFHHKYYLLNESEIENEIYYVYHFYLSCLASNKEEKVANIAMEYFKENETEEYEFSNALLTSMQEEYPSIFKNDSEKKSILFRGIQLMIELKTFGEVYFDYSNGVVATFNPDFQFKLEGHLSQMIEKFQFSYIDQTMLDFIVIRITNYFHLSANLKSTMTEYTVMIISESYDHERYIESKLNGLVPMAIKVVEKPHRDRKIDLIITDMKCTTFYPDIPNFNFLDLFSTRDWIKLREKIVGYHSLKKKLEGSKNYAN